MDHLLENRLKEFSRGNGYITVLTGAGISAESGIPTFRGPEGYWTAGSNVYHPQEMATMAMFRKQPFEVWKWYLYRMNTCADAQPNPGHIALVEMEQLLGDRFTLVTQNVDGLHLRAGNSLDRTYHIHGNLSYMRCAAECSTDLFPMPKHFRGRPKDADITPDEHALLICPGCGSMTRPHVLWFDEVYNEVFFRFDSSLRVAAKTDILIIVGTAGATNLPNQVARAVRRQGGLIIDINIEENPFSRLALESGGFFIRKSSGAALPEIVEMLRI